VLDKAMARRIKLVALDVDGVLTDGGIYLGLVAHHPLEFKRFHVQDGLGVKLLRTVGLPVVLVSGRASEATEARAQEMEVDELLEVAPAEKLPALVGAVERRGLTLADCAYVGDDLADLPLLRQVALPIAVANAVAEVKQAAKFVTTAPGGRGAVREVAELLLRVRGEWQDLLKRFFQESSDVATGARRSR
jgi:3-deoxy-D-manno-octulosonate 8-phosphate phosphatase (KDO 8-P phosphatase)